MKIIRRYILIFCIVLASGCSFIIKDTRPSLMPTVTPTPLIPPVKIEPKVLPDK